MFEFYYSSCLSEATQVVQKTKTMERASPMRKSHTSTADLLTWPENPPSPTTHSASRPNTRIYQPSDGISKVLFGGQLTEEEAQSLLKRKQCSRHKLKEMTGSGIFKDDDEHTAEVAGGSSLTMNKTGLRIYQQALSGISQISFSTVEDVFTKKPTSLPEVVTKRELSGTLESESEDKLKKQLSQAKCLELSGHDIFGPPPEITPRLLDARNLELKGSIHLGEPTEQNGDTMFSEETPIKTAKKIPNQKFQELTGNDIFKADVPPGSTEKPLSMAKRKEMSGSNIFADGKAASRDHLGGVRKPPGGESSIALV